MKFSVGIVSYCGEGEIKEKRLRVHNQQLEWLSKIPIFDEIIVVAMEYNDNEYSEIDPRIKYIKLEEKVHHCQGRDIILSNHFYNTDSDWILMLDNDAILYDHFSAGNFFEEMKEIGMEKFQRVDCIQAIDPRQEPFSAYYQKNKDLIDNNIVLHFSPGLKGSLMLIKNFQKHHSFKAWFNPKMTYMGDLEFACNLLENGFSVYKTKNIVLKEMAISESTLPVESDGGRKIVNDKWSKIIYNEYNMNEETIAKWMRKKFKVNQFPLKTSIQKAKKTSLRSFF